MACTGANLAEAEECTEFRTLDAEAGPLPGALRSVAERCETLAGQPRVGGAHRFWPPDVRAGASSPLEAIILCLDSRSYIPPGRIFGL